MLNIVLKCLGVCLVGYFIGSVNTSIIVSKVLGTDIRQHGSGNAGLTNTLRVLGAKAGILVILGDVLKGIIACYLGKYLLGALYDFSNAGMLFGGLGAILGHNFPIYFGFKGGKGILTTASIVAVIDIKIFLILFVVFLLAVIITRYISVGSIVCIVAFPFLVLLLENGVERQFTFAWSVIVSILALVMHRKNLERLREGKESKFSIKKGKWHIWVKLQY